MSEPVVFQAAPLRDEEWMHAACLSIATGAPGWEVFLTRELGEHCSLAMRKVAELRARVEELEESLEYLVPNVDAQMTRDFDPWPDWFCREHGCRGAWFKFRASIGFYVRGILANEAKP